MRREKPGAAGHEEVPLDHLVRDVERALGEDPAVLQMAVGALFQAATTSDASRLLVARELDRILRADASANTGILALLAGALVERGLSPEAFPAAVFDRLAEMLEAIPDDDGYEPTEAFYQFERTAMACLGRSPRLRRELPQRERLIRAIHRYAERYGFLGKMLAVLDEEPIVVIDVPSGRAWRFVISGIGDNFQLHGLLLGALRDGPDEIRERRRGKTRGAVRATEETAEHHESRWQLASWPALDARGKALVRDDAHWIWNEGVPAEMNLSRGLASSSSRRASIRELGPAVASFPSCLRPCASRGAFQRTRRPRSWIGWQRPPWRVARLASRRASEGKSRAGE